MIINESHPNNEIIREDEFSALGGLNIKNRITVRLLDSTIAMSGMKSKIIPLSTASDIVSELYQ
jgi:hypothetical protein